jgi:hypothetical protein
MPPGRYRNLPYISHVKRAGERALLTLSAPTPYIIILRFAIITMKFTV